MKNKIIFLSLLILSTSFFSSFGQEYAVVFAGGGGKGAYQVGVWQAFNEFGIAQKITVMSGTSVGGLNSALFACVDYKTAEEIWINDVPSNLQSAEEPFISQSGLFSIINKIPLDMLQKKSSPAVIVTAVRKRLKLLKYITSSPGSYAHRFFLNDEISTSEIARMLLATSAFPFATNPVLLKDGYEYTDGGEEGAGGDNIPITPIIENFSHINTIFVVYLSDKNHVKRRISQKDYDSKHIIEIFPSIDVDGNGFWESLLDGTTNFSENRIRLLIRTGYDDASKILTDMGLSKVSDYWFE